MARLAAFDVHFSTVVVIVGVLEAVYGFCVDDVSRETAANVDHLAKEVLPNE